MSAQDLERLRGALEDAHWMDAVIERSTPDVAAERLGFSEPDRLYRGHEGLREWFRDLSEVYTEFRLEPEAYFDLGEQTLVFSVQQGRGRYSGAAVSMPIAQTFRWRDGRIVQVKTYGRRDDALRELGMTEASLPARALQPIRVTSARAAAVRTAYEAYDAGLADFDRHAGILHPEVEWQTTWPGLAPAVHGVEGVRRWVEVFLDPWDWVRSEVRELIETDEETMFVWNHVRARGKESGAEIEMETFDVLTFRDGLIVLRRTWPDRAPAVAAAGLRS